MYFVGEGQTDITYTFISVEIMKYMLENNPEEIDEGLRSKLGEFDVLSSNPIIVKLF